MNKIQPYKYLAFLAAIYVILSIVPPLFIDRQVVFKSMVMSAGSLLVPLRYFLEDIVAEVYGYQLSRQMIWAALLGTFSFAFFIIIAMHLPAPTYWNKQASYETIMGPIPRVIITNFFAIISSSFLNTYLISKWKILLKGKYFWLRSMTSTVIGSAIYTFMAFTLIFVGNKPIPIIFMLMFCSYILKVFGAIVLAFPAAWLAQLLKWLEKVDIYDYNTDFNPFKIEVK